MQLQQDKNKEPTQVYRFTRSKVKFFNGIYDTVESRYDKFVNHILSYRGHVVHRQFSGEFPYVTLAIFYEVPVSVSDELIKEGLE